MIDKKTAKLLDENNTPPWLCSFSKNNKFRSSRNIILLEQITEPDSQGIETLITGDY